MSMSRPGCANGSHSATLRGELGALPAGCATLPHPARRAERAACRGGQPLPLPSLPRVRTGARVGAEPAPPGRLRSAVPVRGGADASLCVQPEVLQPLLAARGGALPGKGPRKMQTNAMHLYTITGYNR